jgi:hypothetical protein
MLLLFAAITLTDAQQAQHDRTELAIYQRIHADDDESRIYGNPIQS